MHTTQSAEIGELAAALCAVQAELKPADKNSVNPFFKSRYADLNAVWEAVRGPLAANGLAVIQTGAVLENGTLAVETTLAHKSGQWIRGCMPMQPVKQNDPQSTVAAVTYGRRSGLSAIVGVVNEDDDDGNTASAKHKPAAKPAPAQPAQPEALSAARRSAGEAYLGREKTGAFAAFEAVCATLNVLPSKQIKDFTDAELVDVAKHIKGLGK